MLETERQRDRKKQIEIGASGDICKKKIGGHSVRDRETQYR